MLRDENQNFTLRYIEGEEDKFKLIIRTVGCMKCDDKEYTFIINRNDLNWTSDIVDVSYCCKECDELFNMKYICPVCKEEHFTWLPQMPYVYHSIILCPKTKEALVIDFNAVYDWKHKDELKNKN